MTLCPPSNWQSYYPNDSQSDLMEVLNSFCTGQGDSIYSVIIELVTLISSFSFAIPMVKLFPCLMIIKSAMRKKETSFPALNDTVCYLLYLFKERLLWVQCKMTFDTKIVP